MKRQTSAELSESQYSSDERETRHSFVEFYATSSTEWSVLCELVKNVSGKQKLKPDKVVEECFEGAAKMSEGLATRMKVYFPLVIYVYCYSHLFIVVALDTMTKKTKQTKQTNFSTMLKVLFRASATFKKPVPNGMHSLKASRSMEKNLKVCLRRYEEEKAMVEKLSQIVKQFTNDQNLKFDNNVS